MAAPVGPVRFWKPGTEGPGASIAEERQSIAEASSVIYNPHASLSIEQQRQKLPVFKLRNHILYLVENYQTVVIIGETGCGKTTQIPQYLTEAGWTAEGRVVGVTQPRRVAAVSVAGRVAEERGALLGHEVGYCIRFDDCTDPQATRIKFLTDGMLVREMMSDPLLTRYRDPDPILRCIVAGFFANAAKLHSTGVYRTVRDGHELHIHPTSVLYAEKPPNWVLFSEVIQTSKYYMRDVTAVESPWLLELAPHFYQQGTHLSRSSKRAKLDNL